MSGPARAVAVVSGAGSGIGREIALALAARGQALALLGRRAEPLAATLAAAGAPGRAWVLDVRDAAAVAAAVAEAERTLGPVEIAVPAAGQAWVQPFAETAAETLATVVATNLLGAAHLYRAVLPAMLERRRGALAAILSVAARQSFPGWSAYAASKAGLLGLIEVLRLELGGSGVRVIAVTPGATATPLWDDLPGDWPRQRMLPAAEVARALVWALDAAPGAVVEEIRLRPEGGDL